MAECATASRHFERRITRVRYRIGEFAELSGVSAKTLRHYDKLGLLRPAAVDSRTRYRGYTAAQLRELSSILALRDLGLSLTEIRAFVSKAGSIHQQTGAASAPSAKHAANDREGHAVIEQHRRRAR